MLQRTKYQVGGYRVVPQTLRNNGELESARLTPIAMVDYMAGHGGSVFHRVNVKLAPVSGYLTTTPKVRITAVFVPTQAMLKLESPTSETAGVTEIMRDNANTDALFGTHGQSEISKKSRILPAMVAGSAQVSKRVRLAYNCAYNHLGVLRDRDFNEVAGNNTAVRMALLSSTAMEMYDGVAKPDERLNAAISLAGELPVHGIDVTAGALSENGPMVDVDGETSSLHRVSSHRTAAANSFGVRVDDDGSPVVKACFESGQSVVSLKDLYDARRRDDMIREFSALLERDPHNGEMRLKAVQHGLSVEMGDQCMVVYDQLHSMGNSHFHPMDEAGMESGSAFTRSSLDATVAAVIPRTEFGGVLVFLASVQPAEVLEDQPHPTLSKPWGLLNLENESRRIDPERILMRDMSSGVSEAEEEVTAFYLAPNTLYHGYSSSGPALDLDPDSVTVRSSRWVYPVPINSNAANVAFDQEIVDSDDVDYPFADWEGKTAEFVCETLCSIETNIPLGPRVYERLDELTIEDVE